MLRTLLMGIVALAALAAVLGGVFFVGLMRMQSTDRAGPAAPVPPMAAPASRPSASVPAIAAADPIPGRLPIAADSSIELPAEKARLSGALKLESDAPTERPRHPKRPGTAPDPPPAAHQAIAHFHEEGDQAEWTATLSKPGVYEVDIICASQGRPDKTVSCTLAIGDQELHADLVPTRGRENYQVLTIGNLTLPPGTFPIRFHLSERAPSATLRLRSLRLVPAT